MATITLRQTKGSPLTIAEVDANFSSLEIGADLAEAATSMNVANAIVRRDSTGFFATSVIGIADRALQLSGQITTTSTATSTLLSVSSTLYRSAKFLIQVTQGTNYETRSIIAIHDGTTPTFTDYGSVTLGTSVVNFDVSISGGNLLLTATPTSATSTTIKVYAVYITT